MFKIILFIDSLGSGGAQRQIVNLAIEFQRIGHEVKVLTYYPFDFYSEMLIRKNIKIINIDEPKPIKRIFKIRKILRNYNQDAVISFLDIPSFLACLSSIGGRDWSLIVGERSADIVSFKKIKLKIVRLFFKYSDYIITNSLNAENIWNNEYPKYSNKIKTIYNGIVIRDFNFEDEYIIKSNDVLNVVIAASYSKVKNIDGLIEAIHILDDKDKKRLIINWYGEQEASKDNTEIYDNAKLKIKKYNLTGVIKLHSASQDIFKVMYMADFVGLFSHFEGLPNAICEGMMLGKPIIMSKISDYHILINKENGLLCDQEDIVSIKEAFETALSLSDEKIMRMGKSSKEIANTLFKIENSAEKYLSLL